MGQQVRKNQDIQVIRRFVGWAEKTRSALYKGKAVPVCSQFVLTSFVPKLCSIHRSRTVSDETGETGSCENHHYLYIALRLAYDFHVKIKTKVSMLLREIFLCEGSLQAIFSILQCSNSGIPVRSSSDVNINMYTLYSRARQFDRLALEYFVKNICPLGKDIREREDFTYSPETVLNQAIDSCATTPILAATKSGDPAMVLFLLRHGANPLLSHRGDELETPLKSPVGFTIDELNISVMLRASRVQPNADGVSSLSKLCESAEQALTCLDYFSRAVRALDIRESSKTINTCDTQENDEGRPVYFQVQPRVAEVIDLTSFRQPPSLRHSCRYVIRRALSQGRRERIPTAIKTLPVPKLIQEFLDLRF